MHLNPAVYFQPAVSDKDAEEKRTPSSVTLGKWKVEERYATQDRLRSALTRGHADGLDGIAVLKELKSMAPGIVECWLEQRL